MDKLRNKVAAGLLALAMAAIGLAGGIAVSPDTNFSASTGNYQVDIASLSNKTVGIQGPTTLAASSTCAARIVTTAAKPIMITFSDIAGQSPTATLGTLQGASTTVTYGAENFGCDLMKAYGFDASTTISVVETR